MKKIAQIFAAVVVSLGFVGNVASAQVQSNCTSIVITNTGANSNNQGTCTVNTTVVVTCINNTYVLNQNDQTAVTGQASVLGNTSGGPAITGNATNTNGSTVQIGSACTPATTTPDVPTTTTTSTTPVTTTPEVKKVATLPYTASSSFGEIALIGTLVAIAVFATARVGAVVYRRIALK